jgi:thioredoxin-like negative regulator of GroEL
MVCDTSDSSPSEEDGSSLTLRIGLHTYHVGLENGVALAHVLLRAEKYDLAARVCEAMLRHDASAFQVAILLACCKARLQEYADCNRILQAVFADGKGHVAEHLQAALVSQSLGMTADALSELVTVADGAPDLPIIWLLLGDEYGAVGDCYNAAACWRRAIDRDVHNGPVALAAQRELTHLEEKPAS